MPGESQGGSILGGLLSLVGKDAAFYAKVRGIDLALGSMSQKEREALFEAMSKRFCLDCGKAFETSGETCNCTGDDDGQKTK